MKVYHYARLGDWKEIKRGSYRSEDKPGLAARHRMGQAHMPAWELGAAFALLEPTPKDWVNNPNFKQTWDYLKRDVGELLLEIEIDPNLDEAYVVDRGYVEGRLYGDEVEIPNKYKIDQKKEAEQAYVESKVTMKEYLERKDELNFSLPEVVFHKVVPIEKISISHYQPVLEESLNKYTGVFRDELIDQIRGIPELAEWYERYESDREIAGEARHASQPRIPLR